MATTSVTDRDDPTLALVRRMAQLDAGEVAGHIPRECYRRSVVRQLGAIAISLALLAAAIAALTLGPWWLMPLGWIAAGTAGWGMVVIAHECGHHAFSKSARLNHLVGHLLMTPLLYPFHSWRLLHNIHHAHTNCLERDNNWVPPTPEAYAALPPPARALYYTVRRHAWWTATAVNWAADAFTTAMHGRRQAKEVRFSIAMVVVFALLFFPPLFSLVGAWGVVKLYVVPWVITHAWFSAVTMMHHTHPELPYLSGAEWSRAGSNLALTIHYRYPRWIERLVHNINVHAPHHVAPTIPFFHLPRAQQALMQAYPELVRVDRFRPRTLRRIVRECHLHDPATRLYRSFG